LAHAGRADVQVRQFFECVPVFVAGHCNGSRTG
jgi:hypothetical protein